MSQFSKKPSSQFSQFHLKNFDPTLESTLNLFQKLENFSNYPISSFGTGRLAQIGGFHDKFGLNLSEQELRIIGKTIERKLSQDFQTCLIPEAKRILLSLGGNLPNFDHFDKYKLSTERDLISRLIVSKLPKGLDSVTKNNIKDFKNNTGNIQSVTNIPINLYLFTGKDLGISGLKYAIFRVKENSSNYKKLGIKSSPIISPSCEEVRNFSGEIGPVNKNMVRSRSLDILMDLHQSGENMFELINNTSPSQKEINMYYDIKSKKSKTILGGILNDTIIDLNIMDGCGVLLVASTKEVGKKLERIINQNLNNRIISGKQDNCLQSGDKDGANVWGSAGFLPGTYSEIRVQYEKDLIASKVGSLTIRAHYIYDFDSFQSFKEKYKKSENLQNLTKNIEQMAGLQSGSFVKPDWTYK
jgi:hypothetical protein